MRGQFQLFLDCSKPHKHPCNSHTLLRLIMTYHSVMITLYCSHIATVQIAQTNHVAHLLKTFVKSLFRQGHCTTSKVLFVLKKSSKADHSSLLTRHSARWLLAHVLQSFCSTCSLVFWL